MTTIIVTPKCILVDTQVTSFGTLADSRTQKLFRVPNGWMALTGDISQYPKAVKAFTENGRAGDIPDALSGFVLLYDGTILSGDGGGCWVEVTAPFMAAGSGAPLALGAMHAGASPTHAMMIVCKIDTATSLPVNYAYAGKPDIYELADIK